jgi:signal peptidase I
MLKKIWRFIWYDDSLLSWIVNILLAFLIVKFLLYPGLGMALGTTHPVVAVVSSSMHHEGNFEQWYQEKGIWYDQFDYTKEQIKEWPFSNGFNKGDIMILKKAKDVKIGDIIVFYGNSNNPIIHRVIFIGNDYYQTKGDNNNDSFSQLGETHIERNQVIGKAIGRIPLLGYVKIIFSEVTGGMLK